MGIPLQGWSICDDADGFNNDYDYSNLIYWSSIGDLLEKRSWWFVQTAKGVKIGVMEVPTKPTVTATTAGLRVELSWTFPPGNFRVSPQFQRKTGSGEYGDWTSESSLTELTEGLTPDTEYSFRVRGRSGGGTGPASDEVTVRTLARPAEPKGLKAVAGSGRRQVTLTWTALGDATVSAWQYRVKVGAAAYNPWTAGPMGASGTKHTVTVLTGGMAYTFQVRAVNGAGNGPASAEATATPLVQEHGTIMTVAGGGDTRGDGSATAASLLPPSAVAADGQGNLYVAEFAANTVWRVNAEGMITMLTQAPTAADAVTGLAADGQGNLYIANSSFPWITRLDADGTESGIFIDDRFGVAYDLAIDQQGNLYIADWTGHRVWRRDAEGTITTVAGGGSGGDNGPATAASLAWPRSVAVDGHGNLYILHPGDSESGALRIRRVDATGTITTVAADIKDPRRLASDGRGNLYVSTRTRVWRMDAAGTITAVAGTGSSGFSGDGGPAVDADLDGGSSYYITGQGSDLAFDGRGNLYIADFDNSRVRRVQLQWPAAPVPPAVQAKPTGLKAVAGSGQVTLTWTDPEDGSITQWQYRVKAGDAAYWAWTDGPAGGGATTHTVTGLANGTAHAFQVRAVNGGGNGPASDAVWATPFLYGETTGEVTAAPRSVMEKANGLDAQFEAEPETGVRLTWQRGDWVNSVSGADYGWQYRWRTNGDWLKQDWTDVPESEAGTTAHLVTGLENYRTYVFEVRPVKRSGGVGPDSDSAEVRLGDMGKPSGLVARPRPDGILLTWEGDWEESVENADYKWQYKWLAYTGAPMPWQDVPDSDASTESHLLTDELESAIEHVFRVRPVARAGGREGPASEWSRSLTIPAREREPTDSAATPQWQLDGE